MIFHPAILALYVTSLLISLMILYSAYYGVQILRKWDIESGSELQLSLERRTYLISTILTYVFVFEIISFFLFIYTAEQLHTLFVGAMCAAGTLKVNPYGYPALILKTVNFIVAGLWLILNYVDNRGCDYPLIKKKYWLLLAIAPFILAETVLQGRYFLLLRPNIITSCCGSLFSTSNGTLPGDIAGLPPHPMEAAFFLISAAMVATGFYFYLRNRGGYVFAGLSAAQLVISVAAILSFISPYFYELPTHHCPFCVLQKDYGFVGYPLYGALFGGAVSGMGVGILAPFRGIKSLADVLPPFQRKLVLFSVALSVVFVGLVACRMVFTDFVLVS
jgi:hypothetical protein